MKKYKEIKIKDIYDIEKGDIIFFTDNSMGFVINVKDSLIHNHRYVVATKFEDGEESDYKYYAEEFVDGEIVLRANIQKEETSDEEEE